MRRLDEGVPFGGATPVEKCHVALLKLGRAAHWQFEALKPRVKLRVEPAAQGAFAYSQSVHGDRGLQLHSVHSPCAEA